MKKFFVPEKYKKFVIPVGLFFAMFILTTVVLIPKIRQVFEIYSKISGQETELKNLTAKVADLQSLSEAELFDSANLLLLALPPKKDFYLVLNSIKKAFLDSSVVIDNFDLAPGIVSSPSSFLEQNKETGLNKEGSGMMVKLEFSSPDGNLKNLLGKIEKTLPLMEVYSLKFNSLEGSGATLSGTGLFSGEMTIRSFSAPLPKTVGKVEKPLPKITASNQKLIGELKTFDRFSPEEYPLETTIVGKDNPFPF